MGKHAFLSSGAATAELLPSMLACTSLLIFVIRSWNHENLSRNEIRTYCTNGLRTVYTVGNDITTYRASIFIS